MKAIFEAYKNRHPVFTAVLALLLGPYLAALFISRFRLALILFAIPNLGCAALIFPLDWLHTGINPIYLCGILSLIFTIGCAVYLYVMAKRAYPNPPTHWYAHTAFLVCICLGVMGGISLLREAFYEPFESKSQSMAPTIVENDYFYADKRAFTSKPPQRGDLIIFDLNRAGSTHKHFKRVMGVGGDQIEMRSGQVFINGRAVERKMITNEAGPEGEAVYEEYLSGHPPYRVYQRDEDVYADIAPLIVPANSYFVLGDYRSNSLDSRDQIAFGFIPAKQIKGQPIMVMWSGNQKKLVWQPLH